MIVDEAIPGPRDHRRARHLVDAHFRGEITPDNERQMRSHLISCDSCRDHYDRRLHLAAVDPDGRLSARERLARGLGLAAARRVGAYRRWFGVWTAIPAAAVLLCLGIGLERHRQQLASGPQARGSVLAASSQLLVYEVSRGGPVRQAIGQIRRDSGLAFAYANTAHKRRLMIFGVDDNRRVFWYQPAWTDPRDNPAAVAVVSDAAIHEIPQAVTHSLRGRRFQLFGAFGDQALTVRDVEAAVKHAALDGNGRLQLVLPGWDVTNFEFALMEGTP